jgi:hypothetical protein
MIVKSMAHVRDPSPIGVVTPCRFTLRAGGLMISLASRDELGADEVASTGREWALQFGRR